MNGPYTVPNPFEWRKYVDILVPSPDGGPQSGARRPTVLRVVTPATSGRGGNQTRYELT